LLVVSPRTIKQISICGVGDSGRHLGHRELQDSDNDFDNKIQYVPNDNKELLSIITYSAMI